MSCSCSRLTADKKMRGRRIKLAKKKKSARESFCSFCPQGIWDPELWKHRGAILPTKFMDYFTSLRTAQALC